jgi:hypothetical protein
MGPDLSSEAWAQIRYDYEHTERPIEAICAQHGISSGTLRDRMRRWGWTRRRPPIPRQGPPPLPAPHIAVAAPPLPAVPAAGTAAPSPAAAPQSETGIETPAPCLTAASPPAAGEGAGALDNGALVPRLESAVARVLPAIEATLAKLAVGPTPTRDMEQAARALSSLTRTLRELNSLLAQRQPPAAADGDGSGGGGGDDDDMPEDIDAFRFELARRIDAFVASRTGETPEGEPGSGAEPQGA